MVRYHHERFDGMGYPYGLKGEETPLGARIFAVADAFHAMISDRPYQRALPPKEATRLIARESGLQFDPLVVGAFLKVDRLAAEESEEDRSGVVADGARPAVARPDPPALSLEGASAA